MFTKLLIFVLLGSTLVLAAPSSETVELQEGQQQQGGLWNQIGKWWSNTKSQLKGLMEKIKKTFDQLINEQGSKIMELGKEKLADMEEKYKELQSQANEAIEKERGAWQSRIEDFKKEGGEALENGKEKLQVLQQQAEEAIQKQTTFWSNKIQDWEQSIKETIANLEQQNNP